MKPSAEQLAEVTARFGRPKQASLASILPQIAGPMLGGYVGKGLAQRLGGEELGQLMGTIGGMTAGKYLADDVLAPKQTDQTAPYQNDPTSSELPPWMLRGAQYMRPLLKQSNDRWQDTVLGEIPGYSAVEGYRHSGPMGALKGTAGQVGGAVGGGLLGLGAGKLLSHFVGRDVNVPLVNMPLSHIIAGLGATVGGAKGFQGSLGLNH